MGGVSRSVLGGELHPRQREHQRRCLGNVRGRHQQRTPLELLLQRPRERHDHRNRGRGRGERRPGRHGQLCRPALVGQQRDLDDAPGRHLHRGRGHDHGPGRVGGHLGPRLDPRGVRGLSASDPQDRRWGPSGRPDPGQRALHPPVGDDRPLQVGGHERGRPERPLRPDGADRRHHGDLLRLHAGERGRGRRAPVPGGRHLVPGVHQRADLRHRLHSPVVGGRNPSGGGRGNERERLPRVHVALQLGGPGREPLDQRRGVELRSRHHRGPRHPERRDERRLLR